MHNNDINIEVYASGTTRIPDEMNELASGQAINFDTYFSGGLYGSATIYVPRNILRWWGVQGAKRLVLRNGAGKDGVVWEGEIDALDGVAAADGEGVLITGTGFWGSKLMRRRVRRYYIDNRVSEDVWKRVVAPASGDLDYRITRSDDLGDVLLFEPENQVIHVGDLIRLDYAAPTGEGIKKVIWDVDFQEGVSDDFTASLNDATGGAAAFSKTADYTGANEVWTGAAAKATTQIYFQLSCGTQGTPAPGDNYFENSDIRVYGWTSNTGNFADNMDEIAKDLVAEFTTVFNSDVTHITTPASPFTFTSFISDWLTLAEVLTKAAGFGDGATPPNNYAVYLDHSEKATTPNGLPVLYLEAWPALTSYDYGVRLTGENVVAPVSIRKDYTKIANWVIVQYTTSGGAQAFKTPDDDATLTDATSTAAYGQREVVLNYGNADSATAIQLGKRYLAQWKDPKYIIEGPINIQGYINDSNGQPVPACRVRAGKRLRVLDYLDNLSGTGLTMVITATSYSADSEVVSITTGALDDLGAMIARLEAASGIGPEGAVHSRPSTPGR